MGVKVSVILPSLNVADTIRECLDSAVNQSLKELEIICVDAGSTDGTEEILQEYCHKDSRIKLIHSEIKSYGRQVNMGLESAVGEYIAVLETDDWIERDMYQCLYECAVKDDLDYAAGDFDTFFKLQNGYRYFQRKHLFGADRQDWYGKTLDTDQLATLRASDYVLWKGIYKRTFLNDNHIRLHESPGAAFQDMGFLQQVKTFARKAKYIDRSFYRYRQGRDAASSVSPEGLRYYEREFQWIGNNQEFFDHLEGIHKKYYYFTMSISFITKYEQILEILYGDWQDIRLAEPYEWFQEQISDAIKNGLLEEFMYGKEQWNRLTLLLTAREEHAKRFGGIKRDEEKRARLLREMTKECPVVIFGCGMRGEKLMLLCDKYGIHIEAFCDNNAALHGGEKFGFRVISPEMLKNEIYDKNEMVLLSMKEGREQVRQQLIDLGIGADRIISDVSNIL